MWAGVCEKRVPILKYCCTFLLNYIKFRTIFPVNKRETGKQCDVERIQLIHFDRFYNPRTQILVILWVRNMDVAIQRKSTTVIRILGRFESNTDSETSQLCDENAVSSVCMLFSVRRSKYRTAKVQKYLLDSCVFKQNTQKFYSSLY